MIPSYFNLFRKHYPDEVPLIPVSPSSAVDWSLIKSIDPALIDFEDEDLLTFLDEFPTYKLSSNDSLILSHPFAIRLFLIMQKCLSAISQKANYYVKKTMKQEKEIKLLAKKNKEYQRIFQSDQNDEKKSKPEKCYTCGKRFIAVKDLYSHIAKYHSNLIKAWKQIVHNKVDERNEIIISNLRIDVNNLRQFIYDQDEKYKKIMEKLLRKNQILKQKIKELLLNQKPQITSIESSPILSSTLVVQPKYDQLASLYHVPINVISDNGEGECSNERIIMAEADARENITNQANIVMQKKKKDFRNIRDAIRIHLEHEIPMPVPFNNASSASINSSFNDNDNITQNPQQTKNPIIQLDSEDNYGSISNDEKEIGVSHLTQTDYNQSMKSANDPFMLSTTQNKMSTNDPFMLSTTQNRTSARYKDDESFTTTTQNPFCITDTEPSSRIPRKSPSVNGRYVEAIESSSRRNKNNVMLITDDENYYSFD